MIRVSNTLWITDNIRVIKLEQNITTDERTIVKIYFYDKEVETLHCSTEREALNLIGKIRGGYDYDHPSINEEDLEKVRPDFI